MIAEEGMSIAGAISWVVIGILLSAIWWQFRAIVFPTWHESWARKHGWTDPDEDEDELP